MRVIEDIHFVISHADVSIYVTSYRRDILKTWIKLLSYVHEMNYQQQHVTIESGNLRFPFVLCRSIARINSLLVDGALSNARKGEILPDSAYNMIFDCLARTVYEVEITSPDLTIFKVDTTSEELYDVGSQDKGISVHIPLHRFLSMLLQKALRRHCESEVPDGACSTDFDFFGHAFRGIAEHDTFVFIMEHPLRIMVFPAALRAGMWFENFDAARSYIRYRSTNW